jgi:hypothetical protein
MVRDVSAMLVEITHFLPVKDNNVRNESKGECKEERWPTNCAIRFIRRGRIEDSLLHIRWKSGIEWNAHLKASK